MGAERIDGGPRSVIVVGAGIVGLSTAWFLQERGVEVTVVDRAGVAAGASWGNAGWIAPALTIPLNQPSVLRYGLRSLLNRNAPLRIPLRADIGLAAFLARFALNCRTSSAHRAVQANLMFNDECFEAFDVLTGNGVDVPVTESAVTALFHRDRDADLLRRELRDLADAGQSVQVSELTGDELYDRVPLAARSATVGVAVGNQRFIDPGRFVAALGREVVDRGGWLQTMQVTQVRPGHRGATVFGFGGQSLSADAVVVATGAWMSDLLAPWVRTPVRAGRGYSFTVPVDRPVTGPVYLPTARVACTPYRSGLRIAGTMEFSGPDDPVVDARVDAIVASARGFLDGVRWDERTDVWVGPRPVSTDGRPLIGRVAPGLYAAGGHGMWGLAHGPITGRALTEQIITGKQPDALQGFDPLR